MAWSRSEKNPDMILGLDDIAATEINWEPKGTTIRRLAEALSLGLDSFVFFDDNPAEREQVRQAIPEVAVVEVPAEPAEYARALQAGLWFEAASLTEETLAKSDLRTTIAESRPVHSSPRFERIAAELCRPERILEAIHARARGHRVRPDPDKAIVARATRSNRRWLRCVGRPAATRARSGFTIISSGAGRDVALAVDLFAQIGRRLGKARSPWLR